ncbi:MAG: hypothetical protein QNJ45_06760 [Ardenticatenaceae bacterium]|nr:hypothetical protein [Ardenticatenaceae bacterium]
MSRLEKLLGFILFIIIFGGVAVVVFLWQQSRLDDQLIQTAGEVAVAAPSQTGGVDRQAIGSTALIAYAEVLNEVQGWQSDAELVSARATWPVVQSENELSEGKESWEFTMYSPEEEAAFEVYVVNGQVMISQARKLDEPLELHNSGGWQLNSPQVMTQFLNNAGRDFLASENFASVTMNVDLSIETESGRPEILVAAINFQNGHSLNVWLDATTGDVIDIQLDQ